MLKNGSFLLDSLLTTCENKYNECVGQPSKRFHQLRQEYTPLMVESGTKIANITGYI